MITIICAGSRGDFQPYIALAQQLQKLGQDVQISGSSSVENLVRSYDIDYFKIDDDFEKLGVDPKLLEKAQSATNPFKMLLTFNKMKKYGIKIAEETYSSLEGSELIIYHPGCTIGYFAAQEMGIPTVLATPFPMHKTNEYLSVVTYGKVKPNKLNKKISYKMIQSMLWLASSNTVKKHWKKSFKRLPKNFGSPYEKINENHPAIVSCSNFVFPKPKDWNKNIHQSGYWFVDENTDYTPSKELSDFLCKGESPIYIGFGSVFNNNQKDELVNLIIEAMKKCKKRGIISGMGKIDNLPDNLISVDNIPHTWLFNNVSLVCHHGGAGTTAAGFRAGVPSVIIPFSNDQFAWAHRAYDLGVAAKPIYRKDLSSDKLAEGITFALREEIINNSKILAKNISKENGALDCAKLIIDILDN